MCGAHNLAVIALQPLDDASVVEVGWERWTLSFDRVNLDT